MSKLYKDIGKRGSGKSTRLLKQALSNHANIAVGYATYVEYFVAIAFNLQIPIKHTSYGAIIGDVKVAPITYYLNPNNTKDGKPVYIDELDLCLNRLLPIAGYTISEEDE